MLLRMDRRDELKTVQPRNKKVHNKKLRFKTRGEVSSSVMRKTERNL